MEFFQKLYKPIFKVLKMCSKTLFKTPAESLKPNHHPAAPTHRWMELHAHIKQGLRVKEQPLLSQMTLTLGLYRTQLVVLLHATYYNLVLAHCSVKRYTKSSGTATLGSQVLNQWQVSACSEKCVGLIIKVRCL